MNGGNFRSCIYTGSVFHKRTRELTHQFGYKLFLLYLDLDELESIFKNRWLWSAHGWAFAEFRRSDHYGDPKIPLKDSIRELVNDQVGLKLDGPIRLLTNLRYLGYVMNPVSFYYCFDSSGHHLDAIVAEVHNTPWGEQHCYVLKWPGTDVLQASFESMKQFHVSPFMPMEMQYNWGFNVPGNSLEVGIENFENGDKVFEARLNMDRISISGWNLNAQLLQFPWMTGKVISAIYWQALKLWWKGVTYFPHPKSLSNGS